MDDARKLLHQAAEAHQPDRDAMLARVERGMTRSADTGRADRARLYRRRRQASWLKVSLAGLVGVGLLGLGGLAVAAGVKQLAPEHPAPVVTPTSQASSLPQSPSSATKPAAQIPDGPASSTPRHSASPTADGPITARADVNAHSTIYWEQNDLTVEVAQPLTSMTVELRVWQSGGVQSTGSWDKAPLGDFTVSVTPADGFLVYRWTLNPGRTVAAVPQFFAAQFNHGTGKRDASKDSFVVEATAGGRAVAVRGGYGSGG